MTTVTLPYQSGDFIFRLANWLSDNSQGYYKRSDQLAVLIGNGWKLYHTTINYELCLKAEFETEDLATMFALRWK